MSPRRSSAPPIRIRRPLGWRVLSAVRAASARLISRVLVATSVESAWERFGDLRVCAIAINPPPIAGHEPVVADDDSVSHHDLAARDDVPRFERGVGEHEHVGISADLEPAPCAAVSTGPPGCW